MSRAMSASFATVVGPCLRVGLVVCGALRNLAPLTKDSNFVR